MDPSSGKSISNRFEICSGLHAVTHLRSWRRGLLRPFHGAVCAPPHRRPVQTRTCPESRSCTYSRSRFWRQASRSSAGAPSTPPSDARPTPDSRASRRESPRCGAAPARWSTGRGPVGGRSASPGTLSLQHRDLLALLKRQVPASEGREHERGHAATLPDQRPPAACDAPTAIAASSLVNPLAISRQNNRSTSRRSDGLPGDFIGALPVSSVIQPAGLPISTSTIEVLRRPVESGLAAPDALLFVKRLETSGSACVAA
jgi:hypothetical protein